MTDQFYTRPELARAYVGQVLERWPDPDVLFVEPSAGGGAFVHPLAAAGRKVYALDTDPQCQGVRRGDFLHGENRFDGDHSAIVTIGNPPFGKNACLAVRFFNQAALYSDEIAFIVPRTFRKISIHKRLHTLFDLDVDADVASRAFLYQGQPHDVPCAWQIWKKGQKPRDINPPPCVADLIDYTTPQKASFAMRRVGFYAGRVITDNIGSLSQTTHYFMREMTKGVIDILRRVTWSKIAEQTAGVRSLSKTEIAFKLREVYGDRAL